MLERRLSGDVAAGTYRSIGLGRLVLERLLPGDVAAQATEVKGGSGLCWRERAVGGYSSRGL